jgi:hypothetical protein
MHKKQLWGRLLTSLTQGGRTLGCPNGPEQSAHRPCADRRGNTPRRLGASLNCPSQTLRGRLHGQPNRRELCAQ